MSGRCKRTAPGTDLGDGRDWFPNGPPQQDRGQRALAERMFAIGYMDAPGRVAHPVKEDIEYEADELLGESHAFVTVAELQRLLKVEAAARAPKVDGCECDPCRRRCDCARCAALRAALATDGAK